MIVITLEQGYHICVCVTKHNFNIATLNSLQIINNINCMEIWKDSKYWKALFTLPIAS